MRRPRLKKAFLPSTLYAIMQQLHFFSDDIAAKYGKKLYRIPLDLALGCPNRPDRFGDGCTFCAEDGSRARHLARNLELTKQVQAGIDFAAERYGAKAPYLAYFQSFTSTFAPVDTLQKMYQQVLQSADFKVVLIGTRPDCLEPEKIAFLAELARQYEVWVELGIQSTDDAVLKNINRGHDFACAADAVRRLADAGIHVAAHMIAGLPGETEEDFVGGADKIAALPIAAVKLHQLMILKNTVLAKTPAPTLNEYDYARYIAKFLRRLPDPVSIMRLVADADPATVIAPKWWMNKGQFLKYFIDYFNRGGEQETFPGVVTNDGSKTLYHPQYKQHFHSLAGADSEAVKKFVEPAQLAARLRWGDVRVLDIGFGLGVNAAAAVGCAMAEKHGRVVIDALELDRNVLVNSINLYPEDSLNYQILDALLRDGKFVNEFAQIMLHLGDARTVIPTLPGPYDAVFQDGFSPDCNPELWTSDFIGEQKKRLAADGVIVSFCSAYPYRGALLKAGLKVCESAPFGRKRGGTVATLNGETQLSAKELAIILQSTAGVPYRDRSRQATAKAIFAAHQALVARLRRRGIPKWAKTGNL